MGRKQKPRVIPAQDNRICGSICLCQLTVVLSCVSFVYLSVAIYMPSLRAFKSGFEPDPVMCQTINLTMATYCPWASCGEWCLTKTSGFCPQIHATVRRNGTDIQLNNCSRILTNSCPEVSFETLPKINCNEGENCAILNGVFNCTKGHCRNMTDRYLCHHTADGITLDPDKENTKLNGFFECAGSRCTKIKRAFSCDRICSKITTSSANVFLMQDNSLITADCETGLAFNEARGAEPGIRISPPQLFWEELDGFLLTNCMTVEVDGNKIKATDCLNGTLVNSTIIPEKSMNFTQLWRIYEESDHFVDPSQKFLPHQSYVTIYNTSRIYINLEGCVNTLKGECKEFTTKYGNDGDNDTAQSRYQCFYNKNDPAFVIARFDLARTYRELIIAASLPTILFVISFTSLCIITRSVKVGDDAKMRCKYCTNDSDLEDHFINPNKKLKRYATTETEHEEAILEIQEIPSTSQKNSFDLHEMATSTKSLIELSPCNETTEKTAFNEKNVPSTSDYGDKPLLLF